LVYKNIDGIHLRGYFLGYFILPLKFFFKFKIFFDTRGFWPDEKADRAGWSRTGFMFRAFKKLEDYLFYYSDHIFFLTEHAIELVSKTHPLIHQKSSVIRTCANNKFFYPIKGSKKSNFLNLGYLGTIDTAYDFKKVACFLSNAISIDTNIHITVMTRSNHSNVKEIFDLYKIHEDYYTINFTRNKKNLNKLINKLDACIFYLNENYSVKASMPTKIAEVLACGVPIICNIFNDDIKSVLNSNCSVLSDFNTCNSKTILKELAQLKRNKNTSNLCLDIYKQYFSLEVGCNAYNSIYIKKLG
jgi:glycosyltransferase involved in cell wall biosynthesis